jgi:hypothetical protein
MHFLSGTFAKAESAECVGGVVLEPDKEFVETRVAEGFEEPFDVRAWETLESFEAETGVLLCFILYLRSLCVE